MKASDQNLSVHLIKICPSGKHVRVMYVYPLEPHFYIEKKGFAGVYLFFLFLLQNIDCGYSLELGMYKPRHVPTIYVLSKNKKNIKHFLLKIFIFLQLKKSSYVAWASFHNAVNCLKNRVGDFLSDAFICILISESVGELSQKSCR